MKKAIIYLSSFTMILTLLSTTFSEESKTWQASDKAKKFVEETNIVGLFANPFGAGWTEDIKKIYGGNKMRVYREVWEGFAPENDPVSQEERARFVNEQRQKFLQR